MTTFGHWIAVAWSDGVVGIYETVTGALRLSLVPVDPVKVVEVPRMALSSSAHIGRIQ